MTWTFASILKSRHFFILTLVMHNFSLITGLNFVFLAFWFSLCMALVNLLKNSLYFSSLYFKAKAIIFRTRHFFTPIIWFYFNFFYSYLEKILLIIKFFCIRFPCFIVFCRVNSTALLIFYTTFLVFNTFLATFLSHSMMFLWKHSVLLISIFLFTKLSSFW